MLYKNKHKIVFFLLMLIISMPVLAINTLQVVALFKGKAVIMIDDKRHTLSIGQTSPEGFTLISADSDRAVIEYKGKRKTYPLGNSVAIGTQFSKPAEKTVQAISDNYGMFHIQGSINGYPVRFLVDTGATLIAMNEVVGKRLGIDYALTGEPSYVSTASGVAKAYAVRLKYVKVGEIRVNNVRAVIIEGGFPTEVLLGMSFLGRVQIERDGNIMRLKKRY